MTKEDFTPQPLPGAMRPRRAVLVAAVALLTLVAVPATFGHSNENPDHGHIAVILGDGPDTPEAEPADLLRYTFTGARRAEADDGTVRIGIPLPADAMLVSFGPENGTGEVHTQPEIDGLTWAFFTWTEAAPPPGTNVTNVTMVAERIVDPDADPEVVWDTGIEQLTVYVELPADYTITHGNALHPANHDVPSGRRGWQNVDLANERLDVTIRPLYEGPNPAFAAPPSPVGGFLVLLVVGLLSGGVWVGTKKLERLVEDKKEG